MKTIEKTKMFTKYKHTTAKEAIQTQKELTKKLGYKPNIYTAKKGNELWYNVVEPGPAMGSSNFSSARSEAQNWVAGMGGAVLQPIGFYRHRDAQKYFTRVRTEGRTPSMYEARTKKGITHKFYVRD